MMFFQRPDYEYGNPAEQPEPMDEELCDELNNFLNKIPETLLTNWPTDTLQPPHVYRGPHHHLFMFAVLYEVRQMANNDPSAVTPELVLAASANTKNWPTRGTLMPQIAGPGQYEWRGPDDTLYHSGCGF